MSVPSSPAGGGHPLQPVSHNAQRESLITGAQLQRDRIHFGESSSARDSTVHDKINQFNTLAMQSKQLERKTADAALKRAMIGREEAEAEMRRYRDEARMLRKQIEEAKARERRLSERNEEIRETLHERTQRHESDKQAWQKGLRRAHKDNFNLESQLVGAKEQVKSSRLAQKAAQEELQAERERARALKQEAFNAQCKLTDVQKELQRALDRATKLEQELEALRIEAKNAAEALKTEAKNAAEARRPASDGDVDEWEGPRKRPRLSSLSGADRDVETLTTLWEWEKERADRALAQVEFLEIECQLKACPAAKALQSGFARRSSPRKRTSMMISDAGDSMILSESRRASVEPSKPTPRRSKTDQLKVDKGSRRSTIFLPAEGIFRTVSQAEADAMAAKSVAAGPSPADPAASVPITPADSDPHYRRTPSVDPPDFAMLSKERTSLLSLLDAPHRQDPAPVFNIPTTPGPAPAAQPAAEDDAGAPPTVRPTQPHREAFIPRDCTSSLTRHTDPLPSQSDTTMPPPARPHTTASYYPTATTTTTKVPLREEPQDGPTLAQRLMRMQRTPSRQTRGTSQDGDDAEIDLDKPSFDATNPALTPTMTREEALAQIRERRGRARSVGRVGSGTGGSQNQNGSQNGGQSGGANRVSGGSASDSGSGSGRTSAVGVRKVSGGTGPAAEVRRKASHGDMAGGSGNNGRRGAEGPRGREGSAPTSSAAAGGIVRGGVAGVRRVRT